MKKLYKSLVDLIENTNLSKTSVFVSDGQAFVKHKTNSKWCICNYAKSALGYTLDKCTWFNNIDEAEQHLFKTIKDNK